MTYDDKLLISEYSPNSIKTRKIENEFRAPTTEQITMIESRKQLSWGRVKIDSTTLNVIR